jgi:hypothetical protein
LKHGGQFTIIRKEDSALKDALDITLNTPVLLRNCLPCNLYLEYTDDLGNPGSLELMKESEQHIYAFNLKEHFDLLIELEGFRQTRANLGLDFSNKEIRIPL